MTGTRVIKKCRKAFIVLAVAAVLAGGMSVSFPSLAKEPFRTEENASYGVASGREQQQPPAGEGAKDGGLSAQRARSMVRQDKTFDEAAARAAAGVLLCGLLCAGSGFYVRKKSSMKK